MIVQSHNEGKISVSFLNCASVEQLIHSRDSYLSIPLELIRNASGPALIQNHLSIQNEISLPIKQDKKS